MKIHFLHRFLMVPAFVAGVMFCQPVIADDGEEDTPLAKVMKESSKALKALRKMPKDDWDGGAKQARIAAEGIRKSMEFIPVMVKEMKDGPEKTKAIADYRRLLGLNYAALCGLELAYLEKDAAKVETAASAWKKLKKEGHKKYEDE